MFRFFGKYKPAFRKNNQYGEQKKVKKIKSSQYEICNPEYLWYLTVMKTLFAQKLFTLTDLLIKAGHPVSIIELSRLSGIERSACWRIVSDLRKLGYLRQTAGRKIEPGLGMIYWGQAACSQTFFPKKAIQKIAEAARKLQVRTALAGLFQDQLVYLYRADSSPLDFFQFPLRRSNLALCILVRKYGPKKALSILRRNGSKPDEFKPRIDSMMKSGFALEKGKSSCNIAFPVERGGEIFGLSFYQLSATDSRIPNLIVQCSLLRNELEKG